MSSACRLEVQVQNGYTQLESLGAAAQFGSPQRSHQSSTGTEESLTAQAEASQGVKLLLRKLKEANATADRYTACACHVQFISTK